MVRSRILGLAALLAAFGFSLVIPSDAQARRCCSRGRRGYYYGTGYATTYNTGTTATGNCGQTTAPTNPDGTMAPQPSNSNAPPAPAPPSAF